jgi:cytochrome P450
MLSAIRPIRRNPLEFLATTWRRHGDVVQFPIPRPATYLISGPSDVRSILVSGAKTQSKRTLQYDNLATVTGNGLLTADDPPWREHRRVVQPAFHHGELAGVVDHTFEALGPWLTRWRNAGPEVIDLDEVMMEVSLQVVASALFGSDWQANAAGLTKSTIVALDAVVARARNPLAPPLWLPTPGNRRLKSATAALDAAVDAVLDERARGQAVQGDLVDLLIAGLRRENGSVDRSAVRDELVTFLVAGHETVASALTWAWYQLAKHPDVADELAAEAQQSLADGRPGLSDVSGLILSRAVVDETLRLYPPAWVITRKLTQETQLADYCLPAAALVIMSPWIVQRHADVWSQPDAFRPHRFVGVDARGQAGYLPFGLGPRICVGRDFALTEAVIVLSVLAREFRFELTDAGAITPLASVTLRPPEGLAVRVSRR